MIARSLVAIAFIALLSACSDDQECSSTSICAPAGPDVEVLSITPATVTGTHPVTGLKIVDSLTATYTVQNLGRSLADSPVIRLEINPWTGRTDTLPPLSPGQAITRTVHIPSTERFIDSSDPTADRRTFRAAVASPNDPGPNLKVSDTVHLRRPIMSVVAAPPAEPAVRVNDPFRMSVTLTNHSAIAPARDLLIRHCTVDFDIGCWYSWTPFGRVPFPDVQPGETKSLTYMTAVTPTSLEYWIWDYWMSACLTVQSDTATFRSQLTGEWICGGSGYIRVIPNYEACSPPVLGPNPVTLSAPNCGHTPLPNYPGIRPDQFRYKLKYVFAFDVVAGQTYHVTITNPRSLELLNFMGESVIGDLDPAPERFRLAESGRYYWVQERWEGSTTGTATVVQ